MVQGAKRCGVLLVSALLPVLSCKPPGSDPGAAEGCGKKASELRDRLEPTRKLLRDVQPWNLFAPFEYEFLPGAELPPYRSKELGFVHVELRSDVGIVVGGKRASGEHSWKDRLAGAEEQALADALAVGDPDVGVVINLFIDKDVQAGEAVRFLGALGDEGYDRIDLVFRRRMQPVTVQRVEGPKALAAEWKGFLESYRAVGCSPPAAPPMHAAVFGACGTGSSRSRKDSIRELVDEMPDELVAGYKRCGCRPHPDHVVWLYQRWLPEVFLHVAPLRLAAQEEAAALIEPASQSSWGEAVKKLVPALRSWMKKKPGTPFPAAVNRDR